MTERDTDLRHMQRACDLALLGLGAVEPNPTVGCVIALGDEVLAEGYHQQFGGPHAELLALKKVPSTHKNALKQASLYVTLEPCCYHGKTPPCVEAIIRSGVGRVVVAVRDPNPLVAGKGIRGLRDAGIVVDVGIADNQAKQQLAPYFKLVEHGVPWVIAKWAMTLDGKVATRNRDSKWISSEESRRIVHELRGRVDGIVIGIGTALADDPLLTARPPGPRTATRIVLDSTARLQMDSQLARTIGAAPVLVVVGPNTRENTLEKMQEAGLDVICSTNPSPRERFQDLLKELGRRRMTNILVEGGPTVMGTLFDAGFIDEVHAFIAPKLAGGVAAPTPIAGKGISMMQYASTLGRVVWQQIEQDFYLHGIVEKPIKFD